jgi:murein DD-endopeptidase MepM/ murein hydrolase activator NlpD
MKKTKNLSNARFYIALCCCVLVIAIVGYAGRMANKRNNSEQKVSEVVEVEDTTPPTLAPAPTALPKTTPAAAPTKAPAAAKTTSKNVEAEDSAPKEKAAADKPTFSAPVSGANAEGFSDGKLIYNSALSDWRTHDGVDISCDALSEVRAAAAGSIAQLYSDARGECVVIDHKNGYTTVYAGLSGTDALTLGQEVTADSVIGKTAEKATGENVTIPHVHFEILHDGENVNPMDFIQLS